MNISLDQAGIVIAIVGSIAGWLNSKYTMRERFARIEVKVDTMWDFQMRRGSVEAISKGLIKENSPMQVIPEAFKWFESMESDLRNFYSHFSHLSYGNLLLEIERNFGKRLVQEICIPRGIQEGACLIVAAAVAKNDPVVDVLDTKVKPE